MMAEQEHERADIRRLVQVTRAEVQARARSQQKDTQDIKNLLYELMDRQGPGHRNRAVRNPENSGRPRKKHCEETMGTGTAQEDAQMADVSDGESEYQSVHGEQDQQEDFGDGRDPRGESLPEL